MTFPYLIILLFNNLLYREIKNHFILKIFIMGIGDWGLGIGPNPQSPIPINNIKKFKKY